jgi:hypothetical protein
MAGRWRPAGRLTRPAGRRRLPGVLRRRARVEAPGRRADADPTGPARHQRRTATGGRPTPPGCGFARAPVARRGQTHNQRLLDPGRRPPRSRSVRPERRSARPRRRCRACCARPDRDAGGAVRRPRAVQDRAEAPSDASTAASTWRRVVGKTGTELSAAEISSSISVQPSTTPSAPASTRWRMTSR